MQYFNNYSAWFLNLGSQLRVLSGTPINVRFARLSELDDGRQCDLMY
jgi:hypothetical protein